MVYEIQTETKSLKTLKIRPKNLNEIVRSWIWLQYTNNLPKSVVRLAAYSKYE